MAQRILRPLTFGELFDEVFDLYKKNFILLVGNVALVTIPMTLIQYLLIFKDMSSMMAQMPTTRGGVSPNPEMFTGAFTGMMIKAVLFALLAVPLQLLMSGAITWAVSGCYLGRKMTIIECYKAVMPKLPALIVTSILVGLIYIAAYCCCCLPIIPAAILLIFVPQIILLEGFSGVDAIKRSVELSRFDWLKVLGVSALMLVITAAISMGISTPISIIGGVSQGSTPGQMPPSWLMAVQTALQAIVNTLTVPLYTAALVLVYYDIRIRKEGFDLQLLAQNMGDTPSSNQQP